MRTGPAAATPAQRRSRSTPHPERPVTSRNEMPSSAPLRSIPPGGIPVVGDDEWRQIMDMHHHGSGTDTTDGAALTRLAVSATLHCLTGCAIGEVLGMV